MVEQRSLAGEWRGEYIDAGGRRARVKLWLDVEGEKARGRYELSVQTEDEPQRVTGALIGRARGEEVELTLAGKDPKDSMTYSGAIRSAGGHAKQAMFGAVTSLPGGDFRGGVWIVWQFPDAKRS